MEPIRKSTLDFLKDIRKNNNREWFTANKARYIEARDDFEKYVGRILGEITRFEPILEGLEASNCIYRINRDIRFSNDKTPYKSHFGAFIVRGGKKNGDRYPGYYFHIEPGNNSMIAGGAYMPPASWLNAIREKIDSHGTELRRIISRKEFIDMFGELEGDRLKSAPKGFQKDHPYIDLLRMKSFLVTRMITDRELLTEECFDIVIRASKIMKPLNDFLITEY